MRLTVRLITVVPMTDHNNNNHDSSAASSPEDDAWQDFLDAHADDLQDVSQSRTARKFDRHAQRQERREQSDKQPVLSVQDLHDGEFVGGRGPRDYSSSWLDTDDVMDQYSGAMRASTFSFSHLRRSQIFLSIILVAGIIGIIVTACIHQIPNIVGIFSAFCILAGAAGLLSIRREHNSSNDDDGARV